MTGPAPTPAKDLTHSGPFPLSAVTSARLPQVTFAPRIICGQGQDTRAHSSWPSPGPPRTTNNVTGSRVALRPPPSVFSSGQLLWAVLDWLFDWLFWLLDCWQPPLWAGSQAQRLDRPGQAGCQGEVGSACSMAADGVAEFLGGRLTQVENATRIAQ